MSAAASIPAGRRRRRLACLIALQVVLAAAVGLAHSAVAGDAPADAAPAPPHASSAVSRDAAQGTGFELRRHVTAGGGGTSGGGTFAIRGTIGQPDADPLQPSTGGSFAITGGFWAGIVPASPQGDPIFADGFEPPPP